jgi:tetratricopeptide (TPR) repeat protein/tRNA A-37 threonylcarbamoyl transferase component Bud32
MSPSPPPSDDRNLLFGVLALQLDFVNRDALIAAMNAWAVDKARPLGRILCDHGALPPARLELLDALVTEHVNKHGGDASASLAALTPKSTASDNFDAVADPAARSTLTEWANAPLRRIPPTDRAGARFRDLEFHAKGGLGQVFRAKDVELNREVAVKEIQAHRADEPASRARFVREAEITGALEHPGIIPVYGLGTYRDGRPFYAMRFVRGKSLKDAIDQYQKAPTPAELRRLAGRLIDVCNAVAYAHSRGVVHRDLKPQNVMLGPFGETLVVDWGLAKAGLERPARDADATTDPTIRPQSGPDAGPTLAGSALGTPGYMSPEQANGLHAAVGPPSDVFGLGAILYCLLTGHKPFEGTTLDDEVTLTKKGLYTPPREMNKAAPPALDAICRKALQHKPEDRYPTALALAADLEKWLADEPVAVYRDPPVVRALRWAKRHRTGVAAAAVLLVTATIGLSLGTARLWKEQRRTQAEFDRAEREHLLAQHGFETARAVALDMGKQVQAIEVGQLNPQQTDLKRRAALDAARKRFEALVADNPDDLGLKKQLAELHRYSGNLSRLLGDFEAAEKAYPASIELWEELVKKEPDDASHPDNLALTLGDLASVEKLGGHLREAVKTLDRALARAAEVKDRVPAAWHQRTTGLLWLAQADVYRRLGQYAEAERAAAAAYPLYDALLEAPRDTWKPTDPIFAANARRARGAAFREEGKVPEALQHLDEAVRRMTDLGGANGDRDVRHNFNKSRLELAATRPAADAALAARELGDVITEAEKLAAEYPAAPAYKEVLADALVRRSALTAGSDPDRAAADLDRADAALPSAFVQRLLAQPDHVAVRGRMFRTRGRLLAGQGKGDEAGTAFAKAVTAFQIAADRDPDNAEWQRDLRAARDEARMHPAPPAKK